MTPRTAPWPAPTDTAHEVRTLRQIQKNLTRALVVIALVAMVFTAANVTAFATSHGVSPWIAWMLDPIVGIALGTVLITDGRLSDYGIRASGWASALRWFTGLATWAMNSWEALWPEGTPFGVPRHVDPAGLILHSVPPVLLIFLAEAVSHYRREITRKVGDLEAAAAPASVPLVAPVGTPAPHPVSPVLSPLSTPAPRPVAADKTPQVVAVSTEEAPASPGPDEGDTTTPRWATEEARPADEGDTPDPQEDTDGPEVDTEEDDEGDDATEEDAPHTPRLSTEEARAAIVQAWEAGLSIREAARLSTRKPSYVGRVFQRLAAERGPQPTAGQLALVDPSRAA